MSILKIKHDSNILGQERELTIIGNLENKDLSKLKVMYFLHGLGNDNNTILEKTNILRHAYDNDFIIIFPNADRSFYTNTTYQADYYDYIVDEIPNFIKKIFNFNLSSSNLYIAGISMGGYGALKIAFNNIQSFCHVISFSGSLDIVTRDKEKRKEKNRISREWESIFGSKLDKEHDLFYLSSKLLTIQNEQIEQVSGKVYIPKISLYIGEEDYLRESNEKLYKHLIDLGVNIIFTKVNGRHDYKTFSAEIDSFFESFNMID